MSEGISDFGLAICDLPSDRLQIIHGHCIDALRALPGCSVQCCVTSPPYWGLRDYGLPDVEWPTGWRGQLGCEPTPDLYVEHMVAVFREVWRVLRDDGTLWVNLGDCYASSGGGGLKAKDLVGIPWRVAFALREDGWYLRRDIIWAKPNPMPESIKDRPTTAHEYVFLFSKAKDYFYDAEAVKEPVTGTANARGNGVGPKAVSASSRLRTDRTPDRQTPGRIQAKANRSFSAAVTGLVSHRAKRSVWTIDNHTALFDWLYARDDGAELLEQFIEESRNQLDVYTVVTAPYKGAHFATFPPDLIRPCIMAGSSAMACAQCGAPESAVFEDLGPDLEHQRACGGDLIGGYDGKSTKDYAGAKAQDASATKARILAGMRLKRQIGQKPLCACNAGRVPGIVLDPFGGSGTTGEVALQLARKAILIEMNPEYIGLARERCDVTPGLGL